MAVAVMLGCAGATMPADAAEPVNIDNFARAETDHYFKSYVDKGCFGRLCHDRDAPAVDKQTVIRMNRDTPYSAGIFDLSSPVTIIKPDTGNRFQSMIVINQDHFLPVIAYAPGTYTLTREAMGSRYVAVLFRTFMDPDSPTDVKAAHAAQDAIKVSQASPGSFAVPDWDEAKRAALSGQIAGLFTAVPDSRGMFGTKDKVDPVRHLIGTAAGWGGNPIEDAKYLVGSVTANDGNTAFVMTVPPVPVDGFWSVTVYNAKGFFEAPANQASLNNVTGKKNPDGSMTIRFGGDPKADNYLRIMPGWSYIVRLYRPQKPVLTGEWAFPTPVKVGG
jgi:hypothetical protein